MNCPQLAYQIIVPLIEDQSKDIATDVKLSVWRLEETDIHIWISISNGKNWKASFSYFYI